MTDGTSRSNSNHTSTQMYTLTQSPGLGRSQVRIQAGPAQKSGRTPVSLHPYWMHTLTALWLCIPEGLWHEVGPHACAWVCVCVSTSPPPGRAGQKPPVWVPVSPYMATEHRPFAVTGSEAHAILLSEQIGQWAALFKESRCFHSRVVWVCVCDIYRTL